MANGNSNFQVHSKVSKDWKIIAKRHKGKEFQLFLPNNTDEFSDEIRIDSVQQLKAIKNSILNSLKAIQIESIAAPSHFFHLGGKSTK